MQQNSEVIPHQNIPFLLSKHKQNVILISQDHTFLQNLYTNLRFLGIDTTLLAPRINPYLSHAALNDHNFLKSYIESFEKQKPITLLHSSIIAMPMPEPDLYGSLPLVEGQTIPITTIAQKLTDFNYISCPTVHHPSEFALRGYIIDFATTQQNIRIEFLGNRIEKIKSFDSHTQRSIDNIKSTVIYPNTFLLDSFCQKDKFPARYQIAFQKTDEELYKMIQHHPESCDINKYTKLLTESVINILDIYNGTIVLHNMEQAFITEQTERKKFEQQHNISHTTLYFSSKEIDSIIQKHHTITINTL